MSTSSHQLELEAKRLRIKLKGTLDRQTITNLRTAVDDVLHSVHEGNEVLLDFTDVNECDVDACRKLAILQRRVGARGCRTALLTDRPDIHGAVWWIAHASKDPLTMPVSTLVQAEQWFKSSAKRLDELADRSTNASNNAREILTRESPKR